MRKILSIILALAVMLSVIAVPTVVFAAASGSFGANGNNLLWEYDDMNRTLTISGTGAMNDFEQAPASDEDMSNPEIPDDIFEKFVPWLRERRIIETVIIGEGVTNIGNNAFRDMNLKSVTIPNSVTSIGEHAFSNNQELKSVTLPNKLTSIGTWAFSNCPIANVTIPASVTEMGERVFSFLENVVLSEGIKTVNLAAFNGDFKSLYIPASVNNIIVLDSYGGSGGNRFEITVAPANPNYSSADGVLFNKNKTELLAYRDSPKPSAYTIPSSVTKIGDYAFNLCFVSSVTIPNSVTSIGNNAFAGCYFLKTINIPESVTSIGEYAFSTCHSLTSIKIPNGVTSISRSAFHGDKSLTSVSIPSSVTEIGVAAFAGCHSLKSITIPSSVTSIGNNAFYGCKNLKSITIPSSVTSIGRYAFDDCSSLDSVYFKGTKAQWDNIVIKEFNEDLQNAKIYTLDSNNSVKAMNENFMHTIEAPAGSTFEYVAGIYPPGLDLKSGIFKENGVITGVPKAAGLFNGINVRVTAENGDSELESLSLRVLPQRIKAVVTAPTVAADGQPKAAEVKCYAIEDTANANPLDATPTVKYVMNGETFDSATEAGTYLIKVTAPSGYLLCEREGDTALTLTKAE